MQQFNGLHTNEQSFGTFENCRINRAYKKNNDRALEIIDIDIITHYWNVLPIIWANYEGTDNSNYVLLFTIWFYYYIFNLNKLYRFSIYANYVFRKSINCENLFFINLLIIRSFIKATCPNIIILHANHYFIPINQCRIANAIDNF